MATCASELIAFPPMQKAYVEPARIKVADTAGYAFPVVSSKRSFVPEALGYFSVGSGVIGGQKNPGQAARGWLRDPGNFD